MVHIFVGILKHMHRKVSIQVHWGEDETSYCDFHCTYITPYLTHICKHICTAVLLPAILQQWRKQYGILCYIFACAYVVPQHFLYVCIRVYIHTSLGMEHRSTTVTVYQSLNYVQIRTTIFHMYVCMYTCTLWHICLFKVCPKHLCSSHKLGVTYIHKYTCSFNPQHTS